MRYNNDSVQPLTAGIPMTTRDPWGPPAADYLRHGKKDSNASNVSTDHLYHQNDYNPSYPGNAYTQEPQPTPHYNDYSHAGPAVPRTQPPFGE